MKQMSIFALAAVAAACVLASLLFTAVRADDEGSPIFGVKIPAGYREWELIAVSHEAGLDELRGILGNAIAMKAYQDGTLPFPDGTIPPSSPGNMCRWPGSKEPSSPDPLRSWSRTQGNTHRPDADKLQLAWHAGRTELIGTHSENKGETHDQHEK
jgi:hypothetical protein